MQQQFPFQPRGASGTTPSAQTAQAIAATVSTFSITVPADGCTALIAVDGAANIAWSYGASSGLTMNNGVFMFANSKESFTMPGGTTQMSIIGASAAGTFRVILGDGQ